MLNIRSPHLLNKYFPVVFGKSWHFNSSVRFYFFPLISIDCFVRSKHAFWGRSGYVYFINIATLSEKSPLLHFRQQITCLLVWLHERFRENFITFVGSFYCLYLRLSECQRLSKKDAYDILYYIIIYVIMQ